MYGPGKCTECIGGNWANTGLCHMHWRISQGLRYPYQIPDRQCLACGADFVPIAPSAKYCHQPACDANLCNIKGCNRQRMPGGWSTCEPCHEKGAEAGARHRASAGYIKRQAAERLVDRGAGRRDTLEAQALVLTAVHGIEVKL